MRRGNVRDFMHGNSTWDLHYNALHIIPASCMLQYCQASTLYYSREIARALCIIPERRLEFSGVLRSDREEEMEATG